LPEAALPGCKTCRDLAMALAGKPVQFTYKGALLHIVPEAKPSKLNNLVGNP
jgi:hypothetical protein